MTFNKKKQKQKKKKKTGKINLVTDAEWFMYFRDRLLSEI